MSWAEPLMRRTDNFPKRWRMASPSSCLVALAILWPMRLTTSIPALCQPPRTSIGIGWKTIPSASHFGPYLSHFWAYRCMSAYPDSVAAPLTNWPYVYIKVSYTLKLLRENIIWLLMKICDNDLIVTNKNLCKSIGNYILILMIP